MHSLVFIMDLQEGHPVVQMLCMGMFTQCRIAHYRSRSSDVAKTYRKRVIYEQTELRRIGSLS